MTPLNATFERTSFFNAPITCRIDNDNIFQTDYIGNVIGQIGVSVKAYKELKDICEKYYNKLVEVGVLQKEKTQEELAMENQKLMSDMLSQMKEMQKQIVELKEKDNVRPDKSVTNSVQNDGVKSTATTKFK